MHKGKIKLAIPAESYFMKALNVLSGIQMSTRLHKNAEITFQLSYVCSVMFEDQRRKWILQPNKMGASLSLLDLRYNEECTK